MDLITGFSAEISLLPFPPPPPLKIIYGFMRVAVALAALVVIYSNRES